MAFAGSALYIAESDQIDAYDYVNGAATNPRTVAADLPDARSPELNGAYAHALKSVAVGPDGAVYFSIGSTGNISAEDRDANPPRATIMRIPPGGGAAEAFATGVRNGTGLAVAPDGSLWTAVNNRDNAPDPDGNVDTEYVNEHPPEALARLTPERELGWPFCNPDGGPADLPFIRDMSTNEDGSRMDCAALPPVEQSFGAHSAPLGLSVHNGCVAAAVCRRCAGRRARLMEPAAAARARSVLLPLARRHSRRSADTCRRFPGRRRIAMGPAGRRGGRTGRGGLHQRRLRRRHLSTRPAGRVNGPSASWRRGGR